MRQPNMRAPRLNFRNPVRVQIERGHEAFLTNISLDGCQLLSRGWFPISESKLALRILLPYSTETTVRGQVTNAAVVQHEKLGQVYRLGMRFDAVDPRFHEFETWLVRAAKAQKEQRLRLFQSQDDLQATALLKQVQLRNALEEERGGKSS